MAGQGKIYTRKAIAQVLELSEKRIKQLTEDGTIEEFSPGHYKLWPTAKSYIAYLRSQIADDDSASDYNTEKARLTRLKREEAELDLQLRRNELHRASDVEFIMTNMLMAFRAKLDTMPYKVLPSIMNIPEGADKMEVILDILKKSASEALNEFSSYNPNDFTAEKYISDFEEPTGGVNE